MQKQKKVFNYISDDIVSINVNVTRWNATHTQKWWVKMLYIPWWFYKIELSRAHIILIFMTLCFIPHCSGAHIFFKKKKKKGASKISKIWIFLISEGPHCQDRDKSLLENVGKVDFTQYRAFHYMFGSNCEQVCPIRICAFHTACNKWKCKCSCFFSSNSSPQISRPCPFQPLQPVSIVIRSIITFRTAPAQ